MRPFSTSCPRPPAKPPTLQPLHLAAGILMSFLWGIQLVAVKLGANELPPLLMVGLRFLLIAALLLPLARLPPVGRLRTVVLIATFSGGLHFALVYLAIDRLDAATGAICYQLGTPITVLVAWAWLGDRMTPLAIAGMAVAFAGVLLLIGMPGGHVDMTGVGLMLLAVIAFAIGTAMTKRYGPFPPTGLNAWTAIVAGPQILLVSLLVEQGQVAAMAEASWVAWGAVVYTALSGGILGFWLWYWLLGKYSVSRVVPFTLLSPVFAIAGGMLVLGEHPGLGIWLGGALVLAGVAIVQAAGSRHRAVLAARDARSGA